MTDDVEWGKTSKKNIPDEDFAIPWEVYQANIRHVLETWGMLIIQDVDHIQIDIEESFKKPIGSIAWVISKVGNKSCIPVNMNQRHEDFKAAFKKAGGAVFEEIKFLKEQKHKLPDGSVKQREDMFEKLSPPKAININYGSIQKPLPYERRRYGSMGDEE